MGIEEILEIYERNQARLWERDDKRRQQEREAQKAGARKWAREFLAIDCELAANKVHMLDLIDEQRGTSLRDMGLAEVYKLLALDAAGGMICR